LLSAVLEWFLFHLFGVDLFVFLSIDSPCFDDLNPLNLKFAKRIEFLKNENFRFEDAMDLLQTV